MTAPMYWFRSHWMRQIYKEGVELSARKYCRDLPVAGGIVKNGDGESKKEGLVPVNETWFFYWCPIVEGPTDGNEASPIGFRLYFKESPELEYEAVIEARKDEDGDFRLFACKAFDKGEAITFISEFELRIRKNFLGGIYVQTEDSPSNCNAYLTEGRVLRSTKRITEGQEIIRPTSDNIFDPYLERIDGVVVSPLHYKSGRVVRGSGDAIVIEYSDGTQETARREDGFGYCYREIL